MLCATPHSPACMTMPAFSEKPPSLQSAFEKTKHGMAGERETLRDFIDEGAALAEYLQSVTAELKNVASQTRNRAPAARSGQTFRASEPSFRDREDSDDPLADVFPKGFNLSSRARKAALQET